MTSMSERLTLPTGEDGEGGEGGLAVVGEKKVLVNCVGVGVITMEAVGAKEGNGVGVGSVSLQFQLLEVVPFG